MEDAPEKDKDKSERTYTPKWWLSELKRSKEAHEQFYKNAEEAIDAYVDKRKLLGSVDSDADISRRMNVWWSIIETQLPAYYARTPKVEVSLKRQRGNVLDTVAAQAWEYGTFYSIEEHQDFDYVMVHAIRQWMLTGRSVLWHRYEAQFEDVTEEVALLLNSETGVVTYADGAEFDGDIELVQTRPDGSLFISQTIKRAKPGTEKAVVESLHFRDYLHSIDRTEPEISWRARRAFMSRYQVERTFGEKIAKELKYTHIPEDVAKDRESQGVNGKAEVWEVWCKDTKKRYFLSHDLPEKFIKAEPVPVEYDDFFPCNVIVQTVTGETAIPICDYHIVRDSIVLIESLTSRIHAFIDGMRVNMLADKASVQLLEDLFTDDLRIIPVDGWQAHVQSGKLSALVDLAPIQPLVEALSVLVEQRNTALQTVYEVTGNSDILRGATSPEETAAAQQLKGNYTNQRFSFRQRMIQEFVRNGIEKKGELIVELFSEPELVNICRIEDILPELPGAQPQQIAQLLRDDPMRRYKLDIETDSMIALDQQAERQQRIDFLTSVGGFIQQVQPLMESMPEATPAFMEMIRFAVRSYRAGKELEGPIDQLAQTIAQKAEAAAQQPPQPDPKVVEAQTRLQIAQAEAQERAQQAQIKQVEAQQRMAIEDRKFALEMEQFKAEQQKTAAELAVQMQELALQAEELKVKAAGQEIKAEVDQRVEAVYAMMEQQKIDLERTRVQLEQYEKLLEERRLSMEQALKQQSERKSDPLPPININVDASKPTKRKGRIQRDEQGNATLEIE